MTQRFAEANASTLAEVIAAIRGISKDWYSSSRAPSALWFRGQAVRADPLLPKLYRPDVVERGYHEETLFLDFKALAPAPTDQPRTEWDWYFLARHHGLPTRHLDWTESALTGLWFALAPPSGDKTAYYDALDLPRKAATYDDASPALWLIDAGSLNRASFGAKEDRIYHVGGKFSEKWLPHAISDAKRPARFWFERVLYTNKNPIAVYPARRNARIIAQQAVFTVHGFSPVPLEHLPIAPAHRNGVLLARITLDSANLPFLMDEVELMGINSFSLFPDLDHLAEHLQWKDWA